jgi:hypothetical protein
MKEQTGFQKWWQLMVEKIAYFMFGWLAELEPPEWRLILLPVGIVTMLLGVLPALIFISLDLIINGEFY